MFIVWLLLLLEDFDSIGKDPVLSTVINGCDFNEHTYIFICIIDANDLINLINYHNKFLGFKSENVNLNLPVILESFENCNKESILTPPEWLLDLKCEEVIRFNTATDPVVGENVNVGEFISRWKNKVDKKLSYTTWRHFGIGVLNDHNINNICYEYLTDVVNDDLLLMDPYLQKLRSMKNHNENIDYGIYQDLLNVCNDKSHGTPFYFGIFSEHNPLSIVSDRLHIVQCMSMALHEYNSEDTGHHGYARGITYHSYPYHKCKNKNIHNDMINPSLMVETKPLMNYNFEYHYDSHVFNPNINYMDQYYYKFKLGLTSESDSHRNLKINPNKQNNNFNNHDRFDDQDDEDDDDDDDDFCSLDVQPDVGSGGDDGKDNNNNNNNNNNYNSKVGDGENLDDSDGNIDDDEIDDLFDGDENGHSDINLNDCNIFSSILYGDDAPLFSFGHRFMETMSNEDSNLLNQFQGTCFSITEYNKIDGMNDDMEDIDVSTSVNVENTNNIAINSLNNGLMHSCENNIDSNMDNGIDLDSKNVDIKNININNCNLNEIDDINNNGRNDHSNIENIDNNVCEFKFAGKFGNYVVRPVSYQNLNDFEMQCPSDYNSGIYTESPRNNYYICLRGTDYETIINQPILCTKGIDVLDRPEIHAERSVAFISFLIDRTFDPRLQRYLKQAQHALDWFAQYLEFEHAIPVTVDQWLKYFDNIDFRNKVKNTKREFHEFDDIVVFGNSKVEDSTIYKILHDNEDESCENSEFIENFENDGIKNDEMDNENNNIVKNCGAFGASGTSSTSDASGVSTVAVGSDDEGVHSIEQNIRGYGMYTVSPSTDIATMFNNFKYSYVSYLYCQ